MSKETVFADTLVNAAVNNGLVRLEFGTLARPEQEGQQPLLEVTHRVAMPISGFVAAMRVQQRLLDAIQARAAQQAGEAGAPKAS
jgi:hypothetical protein